MKRARPPLSLGAMVAPDSLLTSSDVARLLRVHPKHVYRLLRGGLPGHRVGGEWRFFSREVLRWAASRTSTARPVVSSGRTPQAQVAPLLAANGDLAVERLLARVTSSDGPGIGFIQADRSEGLELLRRGDVLAAGCHGGEIPAELDGERLAFVHLVDRQIGLAVRRGVRLRGLGQLGRWRLASRPGTAGVRAQFDDEARRQGLDPASLHARATLLGSHRDVVCAVARDDADVGLASQAWARRVGLAFLPLRREAYGLLVRASLLGDPRVVRLCESAQSAPFRRELDEVPGYETERTGAIALQPSTRHA